HLLCIIIHIVHLTIIKSGIHIYHYVVLRVDIPPFLNKSTTHYYPTHALLSTTTLSTNPSIIVFEINNPTSDFNQHSPNHSDAEDHASTKHCEKLSSSNDEQSPSLDNMSEPPSNTNTHGLTISPQHLARKRKEWNLCQTPILVPLSPEIQASILSSHSKGLNLREMNASLYADTGVEVGCRTLQHYLKRLGLKLLPKDILDGKVTMNQVYNTIHNAWIIFFRITQDIAG
ncbi:hypothetical protein PSTT_16462, partial [Puccinia striiformis]